MERKFDTLDDLVKHVVKFPQGSSRFKLDTYTMQEYDNPEEGAAYDALKDEIDTKYPHHWSHGEEYAEQRKAWNEEIAALGEQPKKHSATHYRLLETGSGYHRVTIDLSDELGKMLFGVWKQGEPYRRASYTVPVGAKTLAGIVKALGQTDIKKQIDVAKAEQQRVNAINSYNYSLKRAQQLATELQKELDAMGENITSIDAVFNLKEKEL